MPLLTEEEVLARASQTTAGRNRTAKQILVETASDDRRFDVFLSHSSDEPQGILLGIKRILEDEGLSVYVDQYTDTHLSPDKVTLDTAETLRGRLRNSKSLLYVYSTHSQRSRWMPWELGFMDGAGRPVGIAPIVGTGSARFRREEYLRLYPYLTSSFGQITGSRRLTIRSSNTAHANFKRWVQGTASIP